MKSITLILLLLIPSLAVIAQQSPDYLVEKMPTDLETDLALSALPAHLREKATVYLLDPKKGYYVARKGTNGFCTFIIRTEWEWDEFSQEIFSPISFDAEGTKTIASLFFDVAEMRASGKYTPSQIKDIIIKRVKDKTYQAPARSGVSYMLAPIMRTHPGTKEIVSMSMPHYMFYAPNVSNADIGGLPNSHHPFVIGNDDIMGKGNNIFNFIILPAGEMEKNQIVEENKELLKRLTEYKSSLKVETKPMHH